MYDAVCFVVLVVVHNVVCVAVVVEVLYVVFVVPVCAVVATMKLHYCYYYQDRVVDGICVIVVVIGVVLVVVVFVALVEAAHIFGVLVVVGVTLIVIVVSFIVVIVAGTWVGVGGVFTIFNIIDIVEWCLGGCEHEEFVRCRVFYSELPLCVCVVVVSE